MKNAKAKELKQWDTLNNYAQVNKVIQLGNNKVQVFLIGSNHEYIVDENKLIEILEEEEEEAI